MTGVADERKRLNDLSNRVDQLHLRELGDQIEKLLDDGKLHEAVELNYEARRLLDRSRAEYWT
jgi:hypothetical protein